jgi:hypothetical protein
MSSDPELNPMQISSRGLVKTIEHFHPKTIEEFEVLVLDWWNLFYRCNCCQQAKGDDFHPALLKPDADDYDFDRYFKFEFELGEIHPASAEGTPDYERAYETIRLYGLNDAGRPRHRRNALKRFLRDPEKIVGDMPYQDFLERCLT